MDILNFERKHVEEATAIAHTNYYDERQFFLYGFGLSASFSTIPALLRKPVLGI